MSVITDLTIFPTDKGAGGVSTYVSRVLKVIKESGFEYKLSSMGTTVETNTIEELNAIVAECYAVLEPDCERVYMTIKLDIRKGEPGRMTQKIASIEEKIGPVNH
jgi:uncharacterized protein (TIGR00106 family)